MDYSYDFIDFINLSVSGMGWVYRLCLSATTTTAASITPRVGGEGGQPGTHLLCQPQQPIHTVETAFQRVRWDILKHQFG